MPSFSIVTPTYNQLDWLRLCIASVRDQVHESSTLSVKHIIQDAGTQGIEDLAREFGAEFHRNGQLIFEAQTSGKERHAVLKIFSEPDAGMYDAVNRGLACATGDFYAYLNSDEQYLPDTLATVAKFFENHPAAEMLFGDALVVDPDGHYLCTRMVTIPSAWHTQVHTLSIFTAATFFRSSLVSDKSIHFRSEWKIIGDAVWILDHLHANTRMALLRKPAAIATETGENLILSAKTKSETRRFCSQAPIFANALKPALILQHRIKRLIRGSYFPSPEPYAIYTKDSPFRRVSFTPKTPTHRLPGRFG